MREEVDLVYFLGIGGIGMSALARYFHLQGVAVCGYDKTETALTRALENEGIPVSTLDAVQELNGLVMALPQERVWVVRTPAVPVDHPQLKFFEAREFRVMKRAEVLGRIAAARPTLAVAGTHGKTTTSTWLMHILRGTEKGCDAFLGGIDVETGSNLVTREGAPWTVVEADEFDRSFHALRPVHAVVTSCEPDHLDIYGSQAAFEEAFQIFADQTSGRRLVHISAAHVITGETYGMAEPGGAELDFAAAGVRVDDEGWMRADFLKGGEMWLADVRLAMAGAHNVMNGLAAAVLASWAGATDEEVRRGLGSFRGVERRFAYHVRTPERVYIDDYAHHPTEVRAAIEAARVHHPGRRVTVIFQPHLFSRTQDQGEGFGLDLACADTLYLLPIYPAREEPIPGIHSQWLFDKILMQDKHLTTPEEIFRCLEADPPDVLLTLGAGDIDRLVQPLKQLMENL